MKVITKREHINGVYLRWCEQYAGYGGDKLDIKLKLKSAKTKQEIDSIIGNDSWTTLRCSCCDRDSDAVMELSNEYECYYVICLNCAQMVSDKIKVELKK